jgi:hypothetical protein
LTRPRGLPAHRACEKNFGLLAQRDHDRGRNRNDEQAGRGKEIVRIVHGMTVKRGG